MLMRRSCMLRRHVVQEVSYFYCTLTAVGPLGSLFICPATTVLCPSSSGESVQMRVAACGATDATRSSVFGE